MDCTLIYSSSSARIFFKCSEIFCPYAPIFVDGTLTAIESRLAAVEVYRAEFKEASNCSGLRSLRVECGKARHHTVATMIYALSS